jgi:hypothetical protein
MHVLAHLLVVVAVVRCLVPAIDLSLARLIVATLPVPAIVLAARRIVRGLQRGEAEAEFAAWYRVSPDESLEFRDGRWIVARAKPCVGESLSSAAAD